jgi:hypothetical protein
MSEPFLERLSRFTPDRGGLDRDALLVAAGRAAARPNRGWIALSAALAVSQVLSLVLLWPRPAPPIAQLPPPAVPQPPPPTLVEPPIPDSADSPGLWLARHNFLESEPEDRAAPGETGTFVDSEPPLRAFAPPPASILN